VAGANFVKEFKKFTNDFNIIEKVKIMVFCRDRKRAKI
jgi:hypothetical protein